MSITANAVSPPMKEIPIFSDLEEFAHELKIPKDRIAVLIGADGQMKSRIEAETKTHIDIDSKEGDVTVTGDDAILLMNCRDIVKAIARGFNPEIAMQLTKADYSMDMIKITDYGDTPNDLVRLKGRVIGAGGKSRKVGEELTDTHISVYGKTVGIIGEIGNVAIARRAVDMLLSGSPHRNVYKWLEKSKKSRRMEQLL